MIIRWWPYYKKARKLIISKMRTLGDGELLLRWRVLLFWRGGLELGGVLVGWLLNIPATGECTSGGGGGGGDLLRQLHVLPH